MKQRISCFPTPRLFVIFDEKQKKIEDTKLFVPTSIFVPFSLNKKWDKRLSCMKDEKILNIVLQKVEQKPLKQQRYE